MTTPPKPEIYYNPKLSKRGGFLLGDFRENFNVDIAEYVPGGLRFDVRRIDGRPIRTTATRPEELRAILIHVDRDCPIPDKERLNVVGSHAIFAYWAKLITSGFQQIPKEPVRPPRFGRFPWGKKKSRPASPDGF